MCNSQCFYQITLNQSSTEMTQMKGHIKSIVVMFSVGSLHSVAKATFT